MLPLSRKQAEVLRTIDLFARREGRMPSVRELGGRLKRTAATVQQHLDALERKGLLTRDGTAHGLRRIAAAPRRREADGGAGPRAGETVTVPVVGRIAAGAPIEAIENRLAEVRVPDAPPGSYALVVRGDSMIENHIVDGDVVVIRPAQVVRQGAVAVCLLEDGSATLKRVYREKGRVRLQPANRALPPLFVKDVRIQGELFAVWRVTR